MRKTIVLTFALVLSLASSAGADPAPADEHAIDPTFALQRALAAQASKLARSHFIALAAGDLQTLNRLWSRSARVTSRTGTKTAIQPIRTALRRWIAARDGLSWTITDAGVLASGKLYVTASVRWSGAEFTDWLIVDHDGEGQLRLVSKTSTAVEAQPVSHY